MKNLGGKEWRDFVGGFADGERMLVPYNCTAIELPSPVDDFPAYRGPEELPSADPDPPRSCRYIARPRDPRDPDSDLVMVAEGCEHLLRRR